MRTWQTSTRLIRRHSIALVKRNLDRFPEDFMFQLTAKEFAHLRFHSAPQV